MIPKVIHYCWLSRDPLPPEARECIKSWEKYLPDFTVKLWNTDNFDIDSVPFVKEAVAARKWAFACDYIRCYALYTEGGIYFDSDVLVRKNMDFVLQNRAFSAIESYPQLLEEIEKEGLIDENGDKRDPQSCIHGLQIQAAILGSEKGHPFFKDCLDYYNSIHFDAGADGIPREGIISPIIMAGIAERYGFKYLNKEQQLAEGFKLYSADLFCPQPWMMRPEAVAVHCCNASWRKTLTPWQRLINSIKTRSKLFLNSIGRKERAIERLK
ncbi:MAG: polysaccharide biosynthesis protein [Bacteroidales bacterium]|nr:polysaccharide biosynthesis protein [Bacteroidales bacterium]